MLIERKLREYSKWLHRHISFLARCICVALFCITMPYIANAQLIYDECIKAADFGESNKNQMIVRPLGDVCYHRCKNECKGFSRLLGNSELNMDHIAKCNTSCKMGKLYSARIREANPDSSGPPYRLTAGEVSSSTQCTTGATAIDSAEYIQYKTSIDVKAGDDIRVKVTSSTSGLSSEIFMCGSTIQIIDTAFESMRDDKWGAFNWRALDNSQSTFHARNYKPLDTGVDIKDGDAISITYGGQYRTNCGIINGRLQCPEVNTDLNFYVKNPSVPFNAGYSDSAFYTMPGMNLKTLSMDDKGNFLEDPQDVYNYNERVKFYGLQGKTWEQETRFKAGLNFDKDHLVINNGVTNVSAKDRYTSFAGVLSGFSSRFTRLGVAHYDKGSSSKWSSHLGGYRVMISRQGCSFRSGERLQYGISRPDPNSDAKNPLLVLPQEWFDVTQGNLLDNVPIKIPYDGLIYLRIKPLPFDASMTPSCSGSDPTCRSSIEAVKQYYTIANTDGQYYVEIEQKLAPDSFSFVITNIIRIIRGYLFGSGTDKPGTVQFLFNKLVADSDLVQAIRALLVLYISWTGISFMIGIAQMTQKEAVTRIIKIGIVVALISPGSWELFNTNFFKLFTDGSLELIAKITAPPDSSPAQIAELEKDPVKIFEKFNGPFRMIFTKETWLKVVALIFAGPLGIVLAAVVALAAIIYAICIVQAVLIYLISLVGIAVLLLLAPIFISFVLFQFTKQMFDAWWKMLMSLAFQPLFVLVFIFVMNLLLEMSLRTALGFTACKVCWLSFSVGVDSLCLFPGYMSMLSMHTPEATVGIPMHQVASVFTFLIISQATYAFTSFGAKIANQLITGGFVGLDLSKIASDAVNNAQTYGATILGIDSGALAAGANFRKRFNLDKPKAETPKKEEEQPKEEAQPR